MKHAIEGLPLNELHGEVMDALVLADAEDRHDVGVMQPGRRLGLPPEPLQVIGVGQALEREDLQGHVPAQRLLDRLVDDPHAAAGHLAKDAVLAQLPRRVAVGGRGLGVRTGRRPADRTELLDHHHRGEQVPDLGGKLWVLAGVFGQAGPLAATEAFGEFVGQLVQQVWSGAGFVHGRSSFSPPGRLVRIPLSRFSARR